MASTVSAEIEAQLECHFIVLYRVISHVLGPAFPVFLPLLLGSLEGTTMKWSSSLSGNADLPISKKSFSFFSGCLARAPLLQIVGIDLNPNSSVRGSEIIVSWLK